ncbi:uncharacterized protein IL334_004108 [Kwoniella shivajii]|uniref:Uncharacterized protein n=1 Tax=Kwoniella shivajii TaxID=564305 RepID=A0ABZ1D0P7_9TREE|nr:hypothetical protein IL334_004108 [Kwoniella shivajii]
MSSTRYYSSYSPTIPNLIQSRAQAISSIPYSYSKNTFVDLTSSPTQSAVPRENMIEVSPTASSPSLYSRMGHSPKLQMARTSKRLQALSESDLGSDEDHEHPDEEGEDADDPRRMSMVGGPKVRKYTQVPWELEQESQEEWSMILPPSQRTRTPSGNVTVVGSADMFSGFSKQASRMINAATSSSSFNGNSKQSNITKASRDREREQSFNSTKTISDSNSVENTASSSTTTRRGLAQILGVSMSTSTTTTTKHLLPSASGLSLASNQTTSTTFSSDDTSMPITPKLRQSQMSTKLDHSPTLTCNSSSSTSNKGKRSEPLQSHSFVVDDGCQLTSLLPAVTPRTISNSYKQPVPTQPQSQITLETLNLTPTPNVGNHMFAAANRPLLSSGSPGFGLISLEAAQERERKRNQAKSAHSTGSHQQHIRSATTTAIPQQKSRPLTSFSIPPIPDDNPSNPLHPTTLCTSTPSSPPLNRVRSKKSGIMRLFNKSDKVQIPPLPTMPTPPIKSRDGRQSVWSDAFPSQSNGDGPGGPPKSTSNRKYLAPAHQHVEEPNSDDGDKMTISRPIKLELRPVSMTFSRGLPVDYMIHGSSRNDQELQHDSLLPSTPVSMSRKTIPQGEEPTTSTELTKRFNEQILNAKKAWRVHSFELEAQIRELKDDLERAKVAAANQSKTNGSCVHCGCDCNGSYRNELLGIKDNNTSRRVIDRARVKTAGARGVFGSGSLYEWE